MAAGATQFIGLSGEYYVSYCLVVRGFHASMTIGNAPNVDILVASSDGNSMLSLQVKTSRFAHRRNRYGYEVYELDVGGSAIGRVGKNIWYAFVDLQMKPEGCEPQVFLVPSKWVNDFVRPYHSRKMYLLKSEAARLCREQWTRISAFFNGDQDAIKWATTVPESAKWRRSDDSDQDRAGGTGGACPPGGLAR